MWLQDQLLPFNVVVSAEVRGDLHPESVAWALEVLQARHPLLRSRIEAGAFQPLAEPAGIPLRVEDAPCGEWQAEAERELSERFSDRGPLARCRILRHGDAHATVLLTLHHAVADAKSGVFLLRDVLRLLSGEGAGAGSTDPVPAIESRFPATTHGVRGVWRYLQELLRFLWACLKIRPRVPRPDAAAAPAEREPCVALRTVAGADFARLRDRTARAGCSVHAALQAALDMAMAEDVDPERGAGICNSTPVDLRGRLGLGEDVGVHLGMMLTVHRVAAGRDLWDLAGEIHRANHAAIDRGQHLTFFPRALRYLVDARPFYGRGVAGIKRWAELAYEWRWPLVTLSNIGRAPIAEQIGPFRVERLAFVASTSMAADHSTFAATVGDTLSWTFLGMQPHVSRKHLERLADRTVALLLEACD
jgi:hypothetical protein